MKIYIATFYSLYGASVFENMCQEKGWAAEMMPVPRRLSSSCGTCVRFETAEDPLEMITDEMEMLVEVLGEQYKKLYDIHDA